jgi:hypothetical protein
MEFTLLDHIYIKNIQIDILIAIQIKDVII